ncbi:hypothetical protein AMTR_s00118p00072930 [Amborella trichopoda]|uniref:Uncharacterized protein n=1 Tax=Amborella trichopoda TaxID=13333 RepID=W1NNZ1_AMBTC|nr:hypothetical protein AMTR_s00118p00072930 [Amborella trichopoda]
MLIFSFSFLRSCFSLETLAPKQDLSLPDVPATVAAIKNPTSKITHDEHTHEHLPPGDPSKRAFAYFVLTGGRFIYASPLGPQIHPKHVCNVTVKWRGKPVFIRLRTEEDIKLAKSVDLGQLRDPQPDEERVKNPE